MREITKDLIEQSIINDTLFDDTTNFETHFDIHANRTPVDRMQRVLSNVAADSTFASKDDAKMYIEETALYRANEIADWVNDNSQRKTQEFNVYFTKDDYDAVGTGFIFNHTDNTIKEYQTQAMTLVLRKDRNSPLGFNILTAYPDMSDPNIEPTNKDLRPIIKETKTYQQSDKIGKTYLECRTNPTLNTLITYKPGYTPNDSMIMIKLSNHTSDTTHFIKFKEDLCTLYTTSDSAHEKIDTKYTQMQNSNTTKYVFKNSKNVNLKDATIRNEFTKDNPSVKQTMNTIYNMLYHDAQNDIQVTTDVTKNRIKQAENLSANITMQNNTSLQKGE